MTNNTHLPTFKALALNSDLPIFLMRPLLCEQFDFYLAGIIFLCTYLLLFVLIAVCKLNNNLM